MPDILNPVFSSRSTLTLGQLRSRVRNLTQLRSTTFLPNSEIDENLNAAQREIARKWKGYKATLTTGTTSGTAEYNLPAPAAARCIQIEELYHNDEKLLYLPQEAMTDGNWRWRTLSGTPTHWMARGHGSFLLYPKPSVTDNDILFVVYAAIPPEVSASEDLFYIPNGADEALVAYACYMASLKDKTGEGAKRTDDFFRLWLAQLKECEASRDAAVEDVVSMGSQALTRGPLLGSYVPPYTTITG